MLYAFSTSCLYFQQDKLIKYHIHYLNLLGLTTLTPIQGVGTSVILGIITKSNIPIYADGCFLMKTAI